MKIDRKWLEEKGACRDGKEWFLAEGKLEAIEGLKNLIAKDELDWANWLIVRVMTYSQYVSYAVFAAEQVIEIYEKKYPKDKRPRQAIEAAKKCIENPSEENKNDAYAAADAAADAADAAYAAADAADAAYAAADAADAAYAADGKPTYQTALLNFFKEFTTAKEVAV